MKTTYLIKSIQSDGSAALVETTAEHWHEITENNKLLPKWVILWQFSEMQSNVSFVET